MVFWSVTPSNDGLTQFVIGPTPPSLQSNGNCHFFGLYFFIGSRRIILAHTIYIHTAVCTIVPSTAFHPCTSPSHRSAPVTLQVASHSFWSLSSDLMQGLPLSLLLSASDSSSLLTNHFPLFCSTFSNHSKTFRSTLFLASSFLRLPMLVTPHILR